MNKVDIIKQKEKELNALKNEVDKEQQNCNHDWAKTIFDPEDVSEPYGFETVGQGSDVWTVPKGYHTVQKNRWSRTCKKCNKTEYTQNQKPMAYEPDFK